jgi:LysM repeat protein
MKLSYMCASSEKKIMKMNNLPSNVLVPGMVLIIPKIIESKTIE